jgi:phosphatidylglycerol:prolipoprotein diacylglycerol transferase
MPGLALAQAIGRWGNFINQELYGSPTDLPWAIKIDEANRLPEYAQYATYHPLFLYESLWNLMNMYLLLVLERQYKEKLIPGDLLLTYLIVYPFGRFLLEFLRLDISMVGGININQITMLVVMVIAIVMLIFRHRKYKKTAEQPVIEEQVETEEKKDL